MKFAQPAWLILLVLLPLLGAGAIAVARLRREQWNAFVASRLRSAILRRSSPLPRWFALIFLLAACASIVIAIARPQGDAGTRTEKSIGRNLLVALDLSRSMRVADLKPDRLAQAKMVIHELIDTMPNERIGLIGFAGSAYIYAPLTVDHSAVRETVNQIDETWTTFGGSNLTEAVRLAIATLRETGQKNNALVIISDGEKHDGDIDDIVAEAREAGVYILTVGVGTEDGDYVPHPDFPGGKLVNLNGQPVISRLQPEILRRLATETKGRYVLAGTGEDIPDIAKSVIKDLDAFELEGRERRIAIEFYQWLLLPGIVFLSGALVAATRWRGVNTAVATTAMLLVMLSSTRADEVTDAKRALTEGRHADARKAYQNLADKSMLAGRRASFRLGEASSAYQNGDFRDARSAYSKSLLTDDPAVAAAAHQGLGVTLFQIGWITLSGKPYPKEKSKQLDLDQFDALVRARLDQMLNAEPEGSSGTRPIENIITSWTDAVRHFDTVLASGRHADEARTNRDTTIVYLKRLQELLKEEMQQTNDSIPQPQPGEGDPGEGDPGEGDEKGDKKPGPGDPKDDAKGGDQEPPDDNSKGDQESEDPKQGEQPGGNETDGKGGTKPEDANESPQDRARRLLQENADLEKGPLTPGRREFRNPAKDW